MPERGEVAKHLWFMGLVWIIPAMTLAGYFIGREYGRAILGALAGAILGTILFWLDILRASGIIARKRASR